MQHFLLGLLMCSIANAHTWCGMKCESRQRTCKSKAIKSHQEGGQDEGKLLPISEESCSEFQEEIQTEFISNHLPTSDCNYSPGKFVINPYKNGLPKRDLFSNVCLKCTSCLAIAHHMATRIQELVYYIDEYSLEVWKEVTRARLIDVCKNRFENFDLRRYKNETFITESSLETEHVQSSLVGQWTQNLRKICSTYISYLDMDEFHIAALSPRFCMEEYFCRGQGIYRDCINLPLHYIEISTENNVYVSVQVNCNKENPDEDS